MVSRRASIAVFLIALVVNGVCAPALKGRAEQASSVAVAHNGLNPANWAFSIWGIFYVVFAIAYYQAWQGGCQELPLTLCAMWIANGSWLLSTAVDEWTAGLGILLAYIAFTLATLQQLPSVTAGGPLFTAACAGTLIWLLAATALNAQTAFPRSAQAIRDATFPLVGLGAWLLLVYFAPSMGQGRGLFCAAVLGVGAWIFVASWKPCGNTLVEAEQKTDRQETFP
jgi:hypothetical protein